MIFCKVLNVLSLKAIPVLENRIVLTEEQPRAEADFDIFVPLLDQLLEFLLVQPEFDRLLSVHLAELGRILFLSRFEVLNFIVFS